MAERNSEMEPSQLANDSLNTSLHARTQTNIPLGGQDSVYSPAHQAESLPDPNIVLLEPRRGSIANYRYASDEQLLEAARSSDGQAFAELSGRYANMVRRVVFRLLRNHEDTEDVLQDALLRAYVHLRDFRGSSTFSSWLTRIAINCALMLLRKRRSSSQVSFYQQRDEDQTWEAREFADPAPDAEQLYAKRQAVQLLVCAVNKLSINYRSVLEQYHTQNRTLREVANVLGISRTTAKARLFRARLKLRTVLEKKLISATDAYL